MKTKRFKMNSWFVAAIVLAALLILTGAILLALPGDRYLLNLIDKARPDEIRGLLATATWAK